MRIVLSGQELTLEDVRAAAFSQARVEIGPAARERVRAARQLVDRIALAKLVLPPELRDGLAHVLTVDPVNDPWRNAPTVEQHLKLDDEGVSPVFPGGLLSGC